MTNFFGSVMETLHTDSAYKSHRSIDVGEAKIKKRADQSISGSDRRILRNMNNKDQVSNLTTEVTIICTVRICSA